MDSDQHFCQNHPEKVALSFCHNCKEYYCSECLNEGEEYYYCNKEECYKQYILQKPPEPSLENFELPYSDISSRLVALMDDIGIIVTFNVLLAIFLNVGIDKNTESALELLFFNPWFLVTGLVYFIIMESSSKQATLGKLFEGLIVTNLLGERINPFRALIRNLSKILSTVILFIGFIMPAFTKRKQALHDLIAGTIILKTTGRLLPEEIECPECNEYLSLSIQERMLEEYYCPTCKKKYNVLLPEEIECLECSEYLGLSIQERILGEYYCPTCNKKIKYTD